MNRPQVVHIDANVQWKVKRTGLGNYVAICDPLRLTIQAESWADLLEDISIALDALLKDLMETNELPKFLQDQGWQLVGTMPRRPEGIRFDVPFFPAMMANYGSTPQLHQ